MTTAETELLKRIISACRRAPRRDPQHVESIYSKRSEEPNTACQRKPTAPLARIHSHRRPKEPSRASRSLSGRAARSKIGFFITWKRN
jgi:hypothetical protein